MMAQKLSRELLCRIAEFSWPCALQQPVTILGEEKSLQDFWERKEHDTIDIIEYSGEPVSAAKVVFLGSSYVRNLSIDRKATIYRRGELAITVTRDSVGVIEVNFKGEFPFSRQDLWYKIIRTSAEHLKLRARIMVCAIFCYSLIAAY